MPDYVYYQHLPENIKILIWDILKTTYERDPKKLNYRQQNSIEYILAKFNNINTQRRQNGKYVLSHWIRSVNIDIKLLDNFVLDLIVMYQDAMQFDRKALITSMRRYHCLILFD